MNVQVLRLPKLGMQMVEGTIEEWLVEDGATVDSGQEILLIFTDKVSTAIESPTAGTIRILVPAGATVEVGTLLAEFS